MTVIIGDDADEFAARAGPFRESRIECNILATVLAGIREGRYTREPPLFAWVLDGEGRIDGAALRTALGGSLDDLRPTG